MASENETVASVADYIRHMADNLPNGVILNIAQCNFTADRIESAWRREFVKYKEHVNELNRQILVLKNENEKQETYLCGYDPDEALVMQCSTCRFFKKNHSHCTLNDSLTNPKYKCSEWKFKTNRECHEDVMKPKRNCDRFKNGDDAFYAFDNECKMKHINPCRAGKKMCTGHDSIHCFKDWLFATVSEGGES